MDRRNLTHGAMLALAALIWGTAFVAQSVSMDYVGPCAFNAARSFVGCIALLPVIAVGNRLRGRRGLFEKNPALLRGGIACGVLLAAANLLQQASLQYISAGKAGFLTALYIVIVPIMGMFLGRRAGGRVWAAVALALVGAYLLSVTSGSEGFSIGLGEILVLMCSVVFSGHILVIDHFSPKVDGVQLSFVQFFTAGCISTAAAILLEGSTFTWGGLFMAWGPLLYVGILSSGVAYTLQIVGQAGLNPAVASLIMSLESVFAAISGWLILSQPLSTRELIGCGLVFAGVVLAQLPGKRKAEKA